MSALLKNPVTVNDHSLGTAAASLELLEYGDYQCPSCGEAYYVLKNVREQLGDQVQFIFRNFPLSEHPDAFGAAMAAEAAALQHRFWSMYDLLYINQLYLGPNDLLVYAEKIGLDIDRFRIDIRSEVLASKIEADFEGGERSGVTGTPNFYVNGQKYDGDWEGDGLIQYLKGLL